jgi:putative redox protein
MADDAMPLTATVRSSADTLRQEVLVNDRHWLVTDEPESLGGTDSAPTPQELLPAALAACVATTIRMFARRQGWSLDEITVEATLETRPRPQRCTITVALPSGLEEGQWRRLEYVARACVVHRTLEQSVDFEQTIEFVTPA